MTFDLFMVWPNCFPVAEATLEEVAWHLQICNCCFYQVSESWPMVFSFDFFFFFFFFFFVCFVLFIQPFTDKEQILT